MRCDVTAKEEEQQIIEAYNLGLMSEEEHDKLLDDITPLLWNKVQYASL